MAPLAWAADTTERHDLAEPNGRPTGGPTGQHGDATIDGQGDDPRPYDSRRRGPLDYGMVRDAQLGGQIVNRRVPWGFTKERQRPPGLPGGTPARRRASEAEPLSAQAEAHQSEPASPQPIRNPRGGSPIPPGAAEASRRQRSDPARGVEKQE